MRRKGTDWEKMFAERYLIKKIANIFIANNSQNSTIKKWPIQFKNEQKFSTDNSPNR